MAGVFDVRRRDAKGQGEVPLALLGDDPQADWRERSDFDLRPLGLEDLCGDASVVDVMGQILSHPICGGRAMTSYLLSQTGEPNRLRSVWAVSLTSARRLSLRASTSVARGSNTSAANSSPISNGRWPMSSTHDSAAAA
jgi:hypothetical protein